MAAVEGTRGLHGQGGSTHGEMAARGAQRRRGDGSAGSSATAGKWRRRELRGGGTGRWRYGVEEALVAGGGRAGMWRRAWGGAPV
jgi:hypothetical protein